MPIKVTCPKCQGVLHAPDDAGGKRGKCPTCGTVLAIPADAPQEQAHAPGSGLSFGHHGGIPQDRPSADALFRSQHSGGHSGDGVPEVSQSSVLPPPPDLRKSSFGVKPAPDARRGSSVVGSQPSFGPQEPRKHSDPFAKPGRPPEGDVAQDARAWRRARRGLWWVRFALFLFLLPVLGLVGIAVAGHFGTKIPSHNPGYANIVDLPADVEIRTAVVTVPVLLGSLAMILGRFGVANAPRSSFGSGLALASAVATLLAVLGLIAFLFPVGGQVATGFVPRVLFAPDDFNEHVLKKASVSDAVREFPTVFNRALILDDETTGKIQRAGLIVVLTCWPLAELWFVVALGRMGASLRDRPLAGRGSRFLVFAGLVGAIFAATLLVAAMYPVPIRSAANEYFWPTLNKLGEHKTLIGPGLFAFAGLVVWFWYARLVGGGRRAIWTWLEYNDPTPA
ncbi:hypothetical protein [Fimbriiglobus ruber]|uniref:Uncharacterized protein n=1 Tax=Fimbriiglobus ruber TaxID=1908690 RepID=A0A225E1M4_9BACT|nr:hypothetical protein [Fimbriiglobus ruber]OWK43936.1 hypothetical protein FRUB_03535 [Fimbriiglobus ruber]